MKPEDSLVSLESDKATMDVPAPVAGDGQGAQGQGRRQGERRQRSSCCSTTDRREPAPRQPPPRRRRRSPRRRAPTSAPAGVAEVRVPDIGDFKDVPVIEVLVKPGDTVKAEDALVTLESDKATMDVPSPLGGTVQEIDGQGRRQGVARAR